MRVLMLHNYYQQRGGEDVVFESEAALLESRGHTVRREIFRSETIPEQRTLRATANLAMSAVWSRPSSRRIRDAIRSFTPDIVHVHNTFPLISASGIMACMREGVPVVQTLHNYRHLCSSGLLYRDGNVCEDCLGRRLTWPGIVHGCYRGSRSTSAAMTAVQLGHRFASGPSRAIPLSIVPSEATRRTFIAGGYDPESLRVKPHFVPDDPGPGPHEGGYALFVGRLSHEKGLGTLLNAWNRIQHPVPLKIIGDGPLRERVADAAGRGTSIELLGHRTKAEVMEWLGDASVLIFPSECQETFGLTIVEAYARATPVIASELGAPGTIVRHGRTGLHFSPGDPDDLAAKVEYLFDTPGLIEQLGAGARQEFRARYTADVNYELLMSIYGEAQGRQAEVSALTGKRATQ